MKRELTLLIIAVAVWISGILAAPLLAGTWISEVMYRIYSIICHQYNDRSFHMDGHPFGVCIRCTAIYSAFFLMLIVIRFWTRLREAKWNALRLLVVAGIPMALDGTGMLLNITAATTGSRLLTGSLFGGGLALLLHADLCDTLHTLRTGIEHRYEPETR
jgi:uncharacterized membrane protein